MYETEFKGMSLIEVGYKELERTGKNLPSTVTWNEKLLQAVAGISTRYPVKILVISAIILVISLAGACRIRFSHDIVKWFPKTSCAHCHRNH